MRTRPREFGALFRTDGAPHLPHPMPAVFTRAMPSPRRNRTARTAATTNVCAAAGGVRSAFDFTATFRFGVSADGLRYALRRPGWTAAVAGTRWGPCDLCSRMYIYNSFRTAIGTVAAVCFTKTPLQGRYWYHGRFLL